MKRSALLASAGLLVAPLTVRAAPSQSTDRGETEPTWEPGEPTTARVRPEIDGPIEATETDGVHERFGGDLDLGLSAGVSLDGETLAGLASVSLHYFWMAGLRVTYLDGLGAAGSSPERLLSVSVDARPAFVPRFAEDLAHGPALLDLTLDSISLAVGVFWAQPEGRGFGDRRGFETSLGLGVPLFARANGLWLTSRGYLRVPDGSGGGTEGSEAAISVALAWHSILSSR